MRFCTIYITAKDVEEAKVIGKLLLQSRLVACVNISDNINSMYWWKGKIQDDNEAVIIAKTRAELFTKVEEKVKAVHSYDCPCILALPILTGNKEYLNWIKEETVQKQ